MSMLATNAPIWKLLELFPEKAQPPHILHATAHKLSNLGPSHNEQLWAVEDICEPFSKLFHPRIDCHCLVA
jgi:hypothetical protein